MCWQQTWKPKRKWPSICKKSDIVTYVDLYSPLMECSPAQMENGRECWTISSEVSDPSSSSVHAHAADVAMIEMEEAHI